jgi:anti-sigma B factor antagonist
MALYSPAGGDFEVLVAGQGGSVVIRPEGELDLATSDRLAAELRSVDATASLVILDLSGLTFVDATGLRVLLEAKRAMAERLVLLPGTNQVQRLFALTRADALLGFATGAADHDLESAAANLAYLRDLWAAYRDGGAQALAARMPPSPDADGESPVWGAGELSAFWGRPIAPVPDPGTQPGRIETVGSSVLVRTEAASQNRPGVLWSLYLFEGRTFIRAVSLAS